MSAESIPRVVFVDDDRLQRALAADALAHVALEVCASVPDALASLAAAPADLVVSDLHMPGDDGLSLLRAVRRGHPGTDFVLMTGRASLESAVEALRMGASDYLQKPVHPDELRLVVDRVLVSRRLALENERLRGALTTADSCRVLASCLEGPDVFAVALELVLRSLGRSRGIAVFRRARSALSDGACFRGYSEREEALLRAELVERKPFPFEDVREHSSLRSGPVHQALRSVGYQDEEVYAFPVAGDDGEQGLLLVPDDGSAFSEEEVARGGIVSGHADVALRNAERYARAQERAFIDDVTELYNARYLQEAMEREIGRAERYDTELSVLFLDLDRFKLVNDNHGHLVGSHALRQLAGVLRQCVRQVDTLARYGGDEFTIVLVDTGAEQAAYVAERIRQTVEETPFDAGRGEVMRLTCSVGHATYPLDGRSREPLIDAADKAMYRAKSLGRNRVCSARDLQGVD